MNDYKHHRPVRHMPDWFTISAGLAVALPAVYAFLILALSGGGL